MSDKISLEDIFNKYNSEGVSPNLPGIVNLNFFKSSIQMIMLDFGKQLLELAAENAKTGYTGTTMDNSGRLESGKTYIDKQSILDTINQIE